MWALKRGRRGKKGRRGREKKRERAGKSALQVIEAVDMKLQEQAPNLPSFPGYHVLEQVLSVYRLGEKRPFQLTSTVVPFWGSEWRSWILFSWCRTGVGAARNSHKGLSLSLICLEPFCDSQSDSDKARGAKKTLSDLRYYLILVVRGRYPSWLFFYLLCPRPRGNPPNLAVSLCCLSLCLLLRT